MLAAAVVVRPVLRRLVTAACSTGDGHASAVVVVAVLGDAAGTQALGLEPVLGAFLAGVIISTVPELEARHVESLRTITFSVLAPVFLASAGLHVDLTVFGRPLVLATPAAVLTVAVGTPAPAPDPAPANATARARP